MSRLAILHSTIRKEEKRLFDAALDRGVEVRFVDIRKMIFSPGAGRPDFEIALERSVSTVKGNYASAWLQSQGISVFNPPAVAGICEDKFLTSLLLQENDIPTTGFAMVFDSDHARQAVDELGGYPVVVKPPLGSWGRLLAKVNDPDALEAVLEHKEVLGTPPHKAYYLQEYIPKQGRDIRAFFVGSEVICAIYRESSHWITNTSKGGRALNCPVTEELQNICARTAAILDSSLLAVDLFETENGLIINELNHTMEFRNSEEPTGVDIAGAIVDMCLEKSDAATSRGTQEETE